MIVVRFMSAKEALLLTKGLVLQNSKQHGLEGKSHSESVGFCFFEIKGSEGIYERARRLTGIAHMDVCLVGEIDDDFLVESKGRYAKKMEKSVDDMDTTEMLDQFVQMLGALAGDKEAIEKDSEWLQEWCCVTYGLENFTRWAFYEPNYNDDEGKRQVKTELSSDDWKKPQLIIKGEN